MGAAVGDWSRDEGPFSRPGTSSKWRSKRKGLPSQILYDPQRHEVRTGGIGTNVTLPLTVTVSGGGPTPLGSLEEIGLSHGDVVGVGVWVQPSQSGRGRSPL